MSSNFVLLFPRVLFRNYIYNSIPCKYKLSRSLFLCIRIFSHFNTHFLEYYFFPYPTHLNFSKESNFSSKIDLNWNNISSNNSIFVWHYPRILLSAAKSSQVLKADIRKYKIRIFALVLSFLACFDDVS